jgi:murein DD-endopeptidase MepM/ murein hydrolase activator NlpD
MSALFLYLGCSQGMLDSSILGHGGAGVPDTAQAQGAADSGDPAPDTREETSFWRWPLDPDPETGLRLNDSFGPRILTSQGIYDFHRGIDLTRATGTPVYAAAGGLVTIAGEHDSYLDTTVQIRHEKPDGSLVISHYTHLSSVAEGISEGQEVARGALVAYTGQGSASYPHLHFELRRSGTGASYQRNAFHPLSNLDYEDAGPPSLSLDAVEAVSDGLRISASVSVPAGEADFLGISARAFSAEGVLVGERSLDLDEWNSDHADVSALDSQELEGIHLEPGEFNAEGHPQWTLQVVFTAFHLSGEASRIEVTAWDVSGNEVTSVHER